MGLFLIGFGIGVAAGFVIFHLYYTKELAFGKAVVAKGYALYETGLSAIRSKL